MLLLRLLPREKESAFAHPPCETRRLLGDQGGSRHVGDWPCTEGERPLAGAVALYTALIDYNLRDETRARGMRTLVRACCVSSREREKVKWRLHHKRGAACLALGMQLAR